MAWTRKHRAECYAGKCHQECGHEESVCNVISGSSFHMHRMCLYLLSVYGCVYVPRLTAMEMKRLGRQECKSIGKHL